ncbi:helix-turn-helix domain-containing protein [Clostridium sp. OS1-26]|uniref:helix-turn-helix domain-containing protein n=1 Tax=Clostridium sp. OS1-26 TaxID=3070681 RepID=UPI0027E06C2C|nr:helix-turn-helix domain-containing protein [Clostridium sp. OS1-26]WML35359.1 helix-turn-helix domain-containing protein [Clostridium sp. OS1-26]
MFSFNSKEELAQFIASEIVDTSEAAELLQCSRQNLDDLVKRGKLTPIRSLSKTKIFFKEDILARLK